jgi:hypothetical protein
MLRITKKNEGVPGVVVHACNPSTKEAEVGGSRVAGQPGLHMETLSQKKIKQAECIFLFLFIFIYLFIVYLFSSARD